MFINKILYITNKIIEEPNIKYTFINTIQVRILINITF